jgi:hypothetical protein
MAGHSLIFILLTALRHVNRSALKIVILALY